MMELHMLIMETRILYQLMLILIIQLQIKLLKVPHQLTHQIIHQQLTQQQLIQRKLIQQQLIQAKLNEKHMN
jgi:hypothetical protein